MVVSLMGSICSTRCLVFATQSIIFFRSPKSPTPKLSLERRENTGTNVPAHLTGGSGKKACDRS